MRLIDAEPFDEFLISIPEDIYDACSFIRGVELVLDRIRKAETIVGADVETVIKDRWE